jgi:hypothetical protein
LDELTRRNVKLSLGGSLHDPIDPWGDCYSTCWRWWLESDLIKMRTREGMMVAKANGRMRGKQPKLKPNQVKHLLELHDSGNHTQAELAELFGVGRSHDLPHPLTGCGYNLSDPSGHSATLCHRHRTPKPVLHGNLSQTSNATVSRP